MNDKILILLFSFLAIWFIWAGCQLKVVTEDMRKEIKILKENFQNSQSTEKNN